MARANRRRIFRLPRRADEQRGDRGFPLPHHRPLAPNSLPAKPKGTDGVAADDETGRRVSPQAACPSSMAKCALCRQTPEVGAECPNRARSDLCGGRLSNERSYRECVKSMRKGQGDSAGKRCRCIRSRCVRRGDSPDSPQCTNASGRRARLLILIPPKRHHQRDAHPRRNGRVKVRRQSGREPCVLSASAGSRPA
jgi:hypothetical protein